MGNDLGVTGGDFRFQGQWLESSTDLYHMRARYYDPESGRFVSRDPVEVIEYEPQSSNPYQFVYHNPLIYLDPSGEITISELNASQNLQDHLASIKRYAGAEAKDYVIEKLGESFGNIVLSSFNAFLPGTTKYDEIKNNVIDFGEGIEGVVCKYFEGLPLKDNLYLTVRIHNGIPQDNGFNCSNRNLKTSKLGRRRDGLLGSQPDFLFRNNQPLLYKRKDPGAYLIGDLKFYLGSARDDIFDKDNQWQNMARYAREYQMLPFVLYLALFNSNALNPGDKKSKGLSQSDRKTLAKEAFNEGVVLILANIIDR
ncbi:MAG: RHS repeat-associated core domain-containing protein [Kamptonema sp. SIO1D9]|nr:RHS repeat-associated core domain-containing protein [Kamptonema sp. SIO1D9]